MDVDGIMLSNGPGDPAENVEIIANLKEICKLSIPPVRHLPGAPAAGPGPRRQDGKAEIRPPRREPACEEPGDRPGVHSSQNHGYAVVSGSIDGDRQGACLST